MIQHFSLGAFSKAKPWLTRSSFDAHGSVLWKNTVLTFTAFTEVRGQIQKYCSGTQRDGGRAFARGHFSRCSACFHADEWFHQLSRSQFAQLSFFWCHLRHHPAHISRDQRKERSTDGGSNQQCHCSTHVYFSHIQIDLV